MKRDSRLWWLLITGGVATALTAHPDLLDRAFAGEPSAIVETVAIVASVAGGVMRMSPLPISTEGRMRAIAKDRR